MAEMVSLLRRCLAIIAASALAASLIVYALSFVGTTMEEMFRWAMLLTVSVFALVLPMYAVEYSAIKNSKFFGDAIWRGLPKWAVRAIQIVGLLFAAHFVPFLVQSHAASPEIINGEYVLSNHGQIVKELTESQYRAKRVRTETLRNGLAVVLPCTRALLVVSQKGVHTTCHRIAVPIRPLYSY